MVARNILLVSFDDAVAPWPYHSAFQEPLRIPTIDALCANGAAFHSAYAQAPICGPSRASMMTSMLPHDLGIVNNGTFVFDRVPSSRCWVADLKSAGVYCSSGGKIHHKPVLPRPHHKALYNDDRKEFSDDLRLPRELRKRSRSFGGHRMGRGALDGVDDNFFFDQQAADSAIDFLQTHPGDQPFYRELGFFSTHGPHLTPARFKEMYAADRLTPPPDWAGYLHDSPYVSQHIPENPDFANRDYWQKSVRNYFSAYSHGDHQLGRVMAALRASPHAQNTVVILVSDHGFHLGNRNLFRKTTLWEQSLHIPFVIYDPDHTEGQVINDPVGLVDLGPTILDYAGVAPQQGAAGRSLRPMLTGQRDPDRALPSFYGAGLTLRQGDFRIIRYAEDDWQLFDVTSDYWQLRNLGTEHPAFPVMRKRLEDWALQHGYDLTAPPPSSQEPAEAEEDA